jgi:penicillin-binding protein 1A
MKRFLKYAAIAFAVIVAVSLGAGYAIYYKLSHSPERPSVSEALRDMNVLSKIRFADGSTACEVGSERRVAITLDKVSPIARNAFLAVEDDSFYRHGGVNYLAVLRAAVWNLTHGSKQGASTITQQVVKNLLLSPERSMKRKVMETSLAFELEGYLTRKLGSKKAAKDKILEMYLNWVNFGSGRYGIESASQDFFGKPASELGLSESVALASLPKSPSKYNLRTKKGAEANASRAKHVLSRMVKAGAITEDEKKAAMSVPLRLVPRKTAVAEYSQEICDAGKKALRAKYCPGLNEKSDKDRLACELKISSLGTSVESSVDAKAQEFAHKTLEAGRNAIAKRHPAKGAPYAAAVAIHNATGEVRVLASSPYAAGGLNYCFARRQPGSTMKPIVYGEAFQEGRITPASVFVDEESRLDPSHPERIWPSNYEPDFMGPVNVRTALAHSVNTVAVQVAIMVGPKNVIRLARQLGITSDLAAAPSLALGVSDISPLEMANAYATFARDGEYVEPALWKSVGGERIVPKRHRAMSRSAAADTLSIMASVITDGTGRSVKNRLPVPSFGKTGTTSGHSDAWFGLGTADYTVMVWVGHKTRMSLGGKETGASAALPIALDIMHFLHAGKGAGAVYSMPTKPIDDSDVVEGADIVEEAAAVFEAETFDKDHLMHQLMKKVERQEAVRRRTTAGPPNASYATESAEEGEEEEEEGEESEEDEEETVPSGPDPKDLLRHNEGLRRNQGKP